MPTKSLSIDEIEIEMTASFTQTIKENDIIAFANVSGDHNPIHIDDEYASKTRYKKRIAHGMLSASFFSGLFGTKLPGEGCLYVSQSLNFKRPVYIGDEVTATISVKRIDKEKSRVFFDTICTANGKRVIDGEAEIYIP